MTGFAGPKKKATRSPIVPAPTIAAITVESITVNQPDQRDGQVTAILAVAICLLGVARHGGGFDGDWIADEFKITRKAEKIAK